MIWKSATPPGAPKDCKLAPGEGQHLLVRPNGSKLWRMKYGRS